MPTKQRVRRDDRRDVAQHLPPQPVRPRGNLPPVLIGEPQSPSTQLPPQHPILFDQGHYEFDIPCGLTLGDERPSTRATTPGTDDPDDALLRLDLEQSLESYVRDRRLLVERLRKLSPADWRKPADHGEYSHYSVFIMFRHVALHDFFHAYRVEELLLNRDWGEEWREAQTAR